LTSHYTLSLHDALPIFPYNSYEMDSPKLKYADMLLPGHVKSDYQRWELHRVWVVEANLKPEARHIYERRVFYIDEDSWQIAVVEDRKSTRLNSSHVKIS